MFVDLTPENLADETLCCIVRMKKAHPGVEAQAAMAGGTAEGRARLSKVGRPGDVSWNMRRWKRRGCPFLGENYLYIYCLWTEGENRGKGYGKALLSRSSIPILNTLGANRG